MSGLEALHAALSREVPSRELSYFKRSWRWLVTKKAPKSLSSPLIPRCQQFQRKELKIGLGRNSRQNHDRACICLHPRHLKRLSLSCSPLTRIMTNKSDHLDQHIIQKKKPRTGYLAFSRTSPRTTIWRAKVPAQKHFGFRPEIFKICRFLRNPSAAFHNFLLLEYTNSLAGQGMDSWPSKDWSLEKARLPSWPFFLDLLENGASNGLRIKCIMI